MKLSKKDLENLSDLKLLKGKFRGSKFTINESPRADSFDTMVLKSRLLETNNELRDLYNRAGKTGKKRENYMRKALELLNYKAENEEREYNVSITSNLKTRVNKVYPSKKFGELTQKSYEYTFQDTKNFKIITTKKLFENREKLNEFIKKRYEGGYFGDGVVFDGNKFITSTDKMRNTEGSEVPFQHSSYIVHQGITNISAHSAGGGPITQVQMGKYKYSTILEGIDNNITFNPDECVIEYLLRELNDPRYKLTKDKLIEEFNGKTASIEEINTLIKKLKYVSMYVLSPLTKKIIFRYKAEDTKKSLVFIINNDHLYPIYDTDLKNSIIKTGFLEGYRYEYNYVDYDYIDEIFDIEKDYGNKKILIFNGLLNNGFNVCDDVMRKTGYIVDEVNYCGSNISSFVHPITKQIYEFSEFFEERKFIFDSLRLSKDIEFNNQSYQELSKIILDNENYYSSLNEKIFDILHDYSVGPIKHTIEGYEEELYDYDENYNKVNRAFGFDICKSYSSVLYNNNYDLPIYNIFDTVEPFDNIITPGEYYINKSLSLCNDSIFIPNGYYPHNFVLFLIDNNLIELNDITYQIKAKKVLDKDFFKNLIEYSYNTYEMSDAKKLINCFIGSMGKKYNKMINSCVTNSSEILDSIFQEEEIINGNEVNFNCINREGIEKLYFIKSTKKTKNLNKSALPLYRYVICGGWINLINLYKSVSSPNSQVISYNTDCVFLTNPNENIDNMVEEDDNILESLGKIRIEKFKEEKIMGYNLIKDNNIEFSYNSIDWIITNESNYENYDNFVNQINELKNDKSLLVDSPPGYGKSYLLCNMLIDEPNDVIILAFTNMAICNVKDKLIKAEKHEYVNRVHTLDSYFLASNTREFNLNQLKNVKYIYIDEYSMISTYHWSFLLEAKRRFNNKLIIFGDKEQCLPVEEVRYSYFMNNVFKELCECNLVNLSYKEESSRYDNKLNDLLNDFLKTSSLNETTIDKRINNNLEVNIVKTNKKRWELNHIIDNLHESPNKLLFNDFGDHEMNIYVGMKLSCKINDKNLDLYNGLVLEIKRIEDNKIIFDMNDNELECELVYVSNNFIPTYSMTVYKYQGFTINENYNIHEIEMMTKRELYTAMSRGTKYEYVNFDYTNKIFENENLDSIIKIKYQEPKENKIDENFETSKIIKKYNDNTNNIHKEFNDKLNLLKEKYDTKIQNLNNDLVRMLNNPNNKNRLEKIQLKHEKRCLLEHDKYIENINKINNIYDNKFVNQIDKLIQRKQKIINKVNDLEFDEILNYIRVLFYIDERKEERNINLNRLSPEIENKIIEKYNSVKNDSKESRLRCNIGNKKIEVGYKKIGLEEGMKTIKNKIYDYFTNQNLQ